ncbi:MAG: SAM-dependent methyltransferase [Gammaproteobacteria bacterium]
MKKGSLTLVGTGIKFLAHLTLEAKANIEKAEKLLYLVNEPAIEQWLCSTNKNAQSLNFAYIENKSRALIYQAITNYILDTLNQGLNICVVFEGHPSVFATPGLEAIKIAKAQGYIAHILPGISAEDYLFADLEIDPSTCGCHSYEATDFLIHNRAFDGYSHLILWQVSVIGVLENKTYHEHKKGTVLLVDHLCKVYPKNYIVFVYEGSQYPHISSKITKVTLEELSNSIISRISTIYIPPLHTASADKSVLAKLSFTRN